MRQPIIDLRWEIYVFVGKFIYFWVCVHVIEYFGFVFFLVHV